MEPAQEQTTTGPAVTTRAGDDPSMPRFGWTRVAMALRSMWDAQHEVLRVEIPGHEPLLVDVAADAYWWSTPVADMPVEPGDVRVGRESRSSDTLTAGTPGSELQELLWHIGLNSFPGELAWWLQRDDRYRLVRWPDFATLAHTPDHVRMTSLLGDASLTVDELAEQADVAPAEARRLVTAFSLMRILGSESTDVALARPVLHRATAAQPVAVQTPTRGGLFRRLLDRIAR